MHKSTITNINNKKLKEQQKQITQIHTYFKESTKHAKGTTSNINKQIV